MPLPRVENWEDHATARLNATIPATILNNFRRAVQVRHGTTYDKMHLEVARALANHTETLYLEARSSMRPPVKETDEVDDPFMRCLHANLGEGDPSSEPEPRVL